MTLNPHWKRDTLIGLVVVAIIVFAVWFINGVYQHGYNEGYDAGYSKALSPWLQVHPEIQWHSTEMSRSEPDWVVGDSVAGWYSPNLSPDTMPEKVPGLIYGPPCEWPTEKLYRACGITLETSRRDVWGKQIHPEVECPRISDTQLILSDAELLAPLLYRCTISIVITDTVVYYPCTLDFRSRPKVIRPESLTWILDILFHPEAEWLPLESLYLSEPELFPTDYVERDTNPVLYVDTCIYQFSTDSGQQIRLFYGPPYPWFWSDSAVANDEHWVAVSSSAALLRDSFFTKVILRYEWIQ